MAISDAQYLAWLQNDSAKRVTLVEAQCHNGSSVVTNYFSNSDFASVPADTPANTIYEDLLREVPRISNSMSEVFGGRSMPALGEIVVDNSSGERDVWLTYTWIGYSVNLLLGDKSWPKSDFRTIFKGVISDVQAKSSNEITFKIRDKQDLLNKQIQSTLYTTGSAINKPKPLCYGEVFKIAPVLIDSATHQYQVHDGAINSIVAVYQDGIAVTYTPSIATGTFTLAAAATGTITCDVQGAKPSGVYLTKVADIANDLALKVGLTGGDIDSSSITALNTACPYTVGIYVPDRANLLDVYDQLFKSIGGYYGFSRAGLLKFGRLNAPTGTATLELIADDIESKGVDWSTTYQPIKTYRLGYKKYWVVQDSSLSTSVTEADRADLGQQYRAVFATNSVPNWPLALEPDLAETLISNSTDAQTEATRVATLNNTLRKVFTIRAFTAPQSIEVGQEIKITYPRYGLDSGVYAIVTGINESPTSNKVELKVWL